MKKGRNLVERDFILHSPPYFTKAYQKHNSKQSNFFGSFDKSSCKSCMYNLR